MTLVGGVGAAPAGPVYATGSPGVSGDTARPNYVGPSGNGLVEADERRAKNLRDQGRSVWPPLSVSRRRSRGLRKTPRWSAERRAGPRYGPAIPSADGRGPIVRRANGCGVPRPRISALRFPHLGLRRVRNRQLGTTVRRDAPRGNAPLRVTCMEKTMSKFMHLTCVSLRRHARAQPSEGRRRFARLCSGHPRLPLVPRRGCPRQARA